VSSRRRPNESDADWAKRQEAARQEVNSHLLVFIHGSLQALTAIGLLQVGGRHWDFRHGWGLTGCSQAKLAWAGICNDAWGGCGRCHQSLFFGCKQSSQIEEKI
jgi:hypothetical protein